MDPRFGGKLGKQIGRSASEEQALGSFVDLPSNGEAFQLLEQFAKLFVRSLDRAIAPVLALFKLAVEHFQRQINVTVFLDDSELDKVEDRVQPFVDLVGECFGNWRIPAVE